MRSDFFSPLPAKHHICSLLCSMNTKISLTGSVRRARKPEVTLDCLSSHPTTPIFPF